MDKMPAWCVLPSSTPSTCPSTPTARVAGCTSSARRSGSRALHALSTLNFWWLAAGVIAGYALAWVGHYFFEKNRPATFTHPVYSFMGDWVMWKDMLTGKMPF
jgi:hypothetical protein